MTPADAISRVRAVLTPDLLNKQWSKSRGPVTGHCYVAAEAVWHLLGGPFSGLKPAVISGKGWTHWFLRSDSLNTHIVDPTPDQFGPKSTPQYKKARSCGFLTPTPSRRAIEVIRRVHLGTDVCD